jgi:hypothetical protein
MFTALAVVLFSFEERTPRPLGRPPDGPPLPTVAPAIIAANVSTEPTTTFPVGSVDPLADFSQFEASFIQGMEQDEEVQLSLFKLRMKKAVNSGWHPPWSSQAPAYSEEQLRKIPTVELARYLFSRGAPARCTLLYPDDPNRGVASLEAVYSGYSELFSRPDCGSGILELIPFFSSQLDVDHDEQSNLSAIMALRSLPTLEMYPPICRNLLVNTNALIRANLQGLDTLRSFVHSAALSRGGATSKPQISANFVLPASCALADVSILFGRGRSPTAANAAKAAISRFRVVPTDLAAVEKFITAAINSLEPLVVDVGVPVQH